MTRFNQTGVSHFRKAYRYLSMALDQEHPESKHLFDNTRNEVVRPEMPVVVLGLKKASHLNGQFGHLVKQAEGTGDRWVVQLEGQSATKSISSSNLFNYLP